MASLTSLVSKMDSAFGNGKQLGENAHVEYTWSKSLEELFVQYYFQLVRTKDHSDLIKKFTYMIENIPKHHKLFPYLYKLVCETRDIKSKQEYALGYMQIAIFYKYHPVLAFEAFRLYCVSPTNDHPFGSWKDVKYMCDHIKNSDGLSTEDAIHHPFVQRIINLAIHHLKIDMMTHIKLTTASESNQNGSVGLIAKWLPREKSKFKWLYTPMAKKMYPDFTTKKAKTHFRKLLSKLNKYVDTVQIKMCGKNWQDIKFNNVTSLTLAKQKNAILNVDKKGVHRSEDEDRIKCSENYKEHVGKAMSGDSSAKIHGKNCNVGELVKSAIGSQNTSEKSILDTINEQWRDNSKNNELLGNIIACADTSGSMEIDDCIPLHNSIGLAIRTSEICHPAFRNRALTFDAQPRWVKFGDESTFCEKVYHLKNAAWGMNTDFYKMLDMILHVLVTNKIPPYEVEDLVLAVFSDMQFDSSYHNLKEVDSPAGDVIRRRFAEHGYKCPHLLFWNLRKTTGFPDKTTSPNVSFISGYSSYLLNIFANKGVRALQESTPFDIIIDILGNERYAVLDTILDRFA